MTVDVDDLAWRAVTRPRTVLLAAPRSYRAGVELDVIDATCPRVGKAHDEARRQDALAAMAVESDLVLVLGPMNSANSRRLVELAHRHHRPAHLIENADAIRPAWLTGVRTIGLTAGVSAPPRLVDGVVALLAELGPVTVSEVEAAGETIHFGRPVSR